MPVTLQMGSRLNSAQIPQTEQHQSLSTCVKVSPMVMGVGIQGKGYAKYFWKVCEKICTKGGNVNVMLITSVSNCRAAGKGLQQVMDLFHCRRLGSL